MNLFDEIKLYLPKYLSLESQENLFSELRQFPGNIQDRLYTNYLDDDPDILQGDGLESMFVTNFPEPTVAEGPVLVLTNTCDISLENRRRFALRIAYCPIIRLSAYINLLHRDGLMQEEAIATHVESIKRQEVSSFFYLPLNARLKEDCIALFDRPSNCDMNYFKTNPEKKRKLFILSNYGLYLFLVKLAIHLTRVQEGIDRR
jgi:hypothetical protein